MGRNRNQTTAEKYAYGYQEIMRPRPNGRIEAMEKDRGWKEREVKAEAQWKSRQQKNNSKNRNKQYQWNHIP